MNFTRKELTSGANQNEMQWIVLFLYKKSAKIFEFKIALLL